MNLLLAALLVLQEKAPGNDGDAAFRKIEDAVRGAKTLQLTFATSPSGPSDQESCTGSLALSTGNKLRFTARTVKKPGPDGSAATRDYWVISDGSKLMSSESPGELLVPRDFDRSVRWMLLFAGAVECVMLPEYLDPKKRAEPFGTGCFEVSNFERKWTEEATKKAGFGFTVNLHRAKAKYSHELEVGLGGLRILSHTDRGHVPLVATDEGGTESYPTFSLNTDIPDETFKLPDQKK